MTHLEVIRLFPVLVDIGSLTYLFETFFILVGCQWNEFEN